MNIPLDWLLEGEPYIAYRARVDLRGQAESDPAVKAARKEMLADPRVQALLAELAEYPGEVLSSHKSASQSFHKLAFLADLGLRASDAAMQPIIARVLSHQSDEGPFTLPMKIGEHYGGSGQEQWAWALCDAPITAYAMVALGMETKPAVRRAIKHLVGLVRDNGFPCAVSKELGAWRGPGRKEDPCPFANLAMLKLLAASAEHRDSDAAHIGAETMLALWKDSRTRHPYIFYMGTDFRKLKAPLIWYDLLHVFDVLTRFAWLRSDARLLDMQAVLRDKGDEHGRFSAESVYTPFKTWEFGQKKTPSRWITLLAWRAMRRLPE